MITTLTVNPSLDKTFTIHRLERGEVNRILSVSAEPAGKGVNVARALFDNGHDAIAVLTIGGPDGEELSRLLTETGVAVRPVPVTGAVRANISVIEDDGVVTKLNEPGPALSESELMALAETVLAATPSGGWLVACGSLPPGVPTNFYADLIGRANSVGIRTALDTSGEPLRSGCAAKPDLLKPNLDELRDLNGPLSTISEVITAGQDLVRKGIETVLVSLGAAGAVAITEATVEHGSAAVDSVRNTVGAGDNLLAGYLAGLIEGGDVASALRNGLAWARAAVRSSMTRMETLTDEDYAAVTISDQIPAGLHLDDGDR